MNRQEKILLISALQNGTPITELGGELIHMMEHKPGNFIEGRNSGKGYKAIPAAELDSYISDRKKEMGPHTQVVITHHEEYKTFSAKLEAEY